MSEPLLICESPEPDDVAYAAAVALAYGDAPGSQQGRSKVIKRRWKQTRKVTPHVLSWLERNGWNDAPAGSVRDRAEDRCEADVRAGLGPIQAWLLGQAIQLIVRLIVRWYFSGQSRAYRTAMQSRRGGQ